VIKIHTAGPSGSKYDDWRVRAIKKRDKDIANWKENGRPRPGPKPNQELWAELKQIFLSDVFHDKCAYCEGNHASGYPAHVEHYRPKLMVTEERQAIDHPGYFWLAYEWENLLLSCAHCNSNHSSIKDGEKVSHYGKLNEFRIQGQRVSEPSADPSQWQKELKAEQPLLLNSYDDEEPNLHIGFSKDGTVYAKTGKGKETVDVCDLNRIELVEARRSEAKKSARTRIYDRLAVIERDQTKIDEPFFDPSEPFSAWLNHYAMILVENLFAPFAKT